MRHILDENGRYFENQVDGDGLASQSSKIVWDTTIRWAPRWTLI
jgi:hypothetical protein